MKETINFKLTPVRAPNQQESSESPETKSNLNDFLIVDYNDVSKQNIFDTYEKLRQCALIKGDNLEVMKDFPSGSIDLIYLDPPFFTGRTLSLKGKRVYRKSGKELSFNDAWRGYGEYLSWMRSRLIQCRRVLKHTGSIYLHCDWHASHLLRTLLDEVFSLKQFRSEIVWYYKRWTNNFRSFQRSHELIYFYSKTDKYKFNVQHEDYSYTTNIDQIWQKRVRDKNGKSTYAKLDGYSLPLNREKKGVPLRDVWEIPYLNPKAKERTGYPTQKPVELLLKIVKASSDEGDIILDPVCGSGTTLAAAKILGRRWIGIDHNEDAIRISKTRLESEIEKVISVEHYTPYRLSQFLKLSRHEKIQHLGRLLNMNIVHRSKDIDGFLRNTGQWNNIAVKYIEHGDVKSAITSFISASLKRHCDLGIVILPKTNKQETKTLEKIFPKNIKSYIVGYKDILTNRFLKEVLFDKSN